MAERDLEKECWDALDAVKAAEDLPLRLKALEILAKIRVAHLRVKPLGRSGRRDPAVEKALQDRNGATDGRA